MSLLDLMEAQTRANDPKTSKDAAKNIKADSIRRSILFILEKSGSEGLASFELALELSLPRDYVSPHLKPLERLGFTKKSGKTRLNPITSNNTECEVWIVTDKYHQEFRSRKQELSMVDIYDTSIARLEQEIEMCNKRISLIKLKKEREDRCSIIKMF